MTKPPNPKRRPPSPSRPLGGHHRANPGKPVNPGRLPLIVQMRGTIEYQNWMIRFAATQNDASFAELVERALVNLAKGEGFEGPPKRLGERKEQS